jgi:phosphate transport system substrate-binding protein
MKNSKNSVNTRRWLSLILFTTGLTTACSNRGDQPIVVIDGSSTVFPITDFVADQFQKRNPVKIDVKVPVGVSGTRGGFRKFCAGTIDISDASRPINQEEAALCKKNRIEFIEIPIGYDGLTVVVNSKNTWAHDITTAELKKIWEPEALRRIMRWSQVRAGWPDREMHLYGAGLDSGTYDYFTEAILRTEHESRTDFESSENDDQLARAIARDELALGFFGYAYLQKNATQLKALAVDDQNPKNGEGPVLPSPDTVRRGVYQPLSRPLFIYVNKASLARREVELFTLFYLTKATTFVSRVGYVPLPERAYRLAQERVGARRTGSLFGNKGSRVGLSIEQLLAQEGPLATSSGTPDSP